MQSKIIYIVLFMLSFNIFHDSFISIIDKTPHNNETIYSSCDIEESSKCVEFNKIHNLLHFIAIITPFENNYIHTTLQEKYTLQLKQYTPPLKENSFKPPII
ncbi:MAG: hypothetical protein QM493_07455 [Sulfurovum sp.]